MLADHSAARPPGRFSFATDIADAVIRLIDGAASMTGELLLLDSGMHLDKGLSNGGVWGPHGPLEAHGSRWLWMHLEDRIGPG